MVPIQSPTYDSQRTFVSRAGVKLHAAIETLGISLAGNVAADLGCNVGGFTDCLLQQGAARVFAIDTAYGVLAWTLRKDPRVVVMERTNALHPKLPELVDLVVIDVGWTRQDKILPVAMKLLKPGGQLLTLIKPHYESDQAQKQQGVLDEGQAIAVVERVLEEISELGLEVRGVVKSPLEGQKGNVEFVAHLVPKS